MTKAKFEIDPSVTVSWNCDECGERFLRLRADARYCKGACRQAAYRKRHATAKPLRKRRPITDAMQDAIYDLRRAAERVERLLSDDRFDANADTILDRSGWQVAAVAEIVGQLTARGVTGTWAGDGSGRP